MKSKNWGPRLLLVLGLFIIAPSMTALGVWQLNRWQARRSENALIRARLNETALVVTGAPWAEVSELDYRPAQVTGVYDFSQEVVLKNRFHNGLAGVHVLTPLWIENASTAILIDRGWIPYTAQAAEARALYQTPTGLITVTGLLRASQVNTSPFLPDDPLGGRLEAWAWLTLPHLQTQIPYPILPMYLEEAARAAPTQLPLAANEMDLTAGSHLSYALQWFAFALLAVIGPVVYWRQPPPAAR